MSLDPNAVRLANERLWNAHPELKKRSLTYGASDAALRAEWTRNYKDATTASAPPPAVTPGPASPPPSVPIIASCSKPAAAAVTDCKDVKNHLQEGDIVLRGERGQDESDFIAKVSKCNYSHAGVIARDDKGDLVVVDAYPGRGSGAVAAITVDSFFCDKKYGATHGLAARPQDHAAAVKAADWAMKQTKDPDYVFDLFDPWNNDPKRLYCADFVYQSYQNAGVDLVPAKMDFLSAENKKNTLAAARDFKPGAKLVSDEKLQNELLKKTGGSSEYITPCQVAQNSQADTVVNFDTAKPSASSGGKKGGGKS